jgi:hypothetical protein
MVWDGRLVNTWPVHHRFRFETVAGLVPEAELRG